MNILYTNLRILLTTPYEEIQTFVLKNQLGIEWSVQRVLQLDILRCFSIEETTVARKCFFFVVFPMLAI